MEILLAKTFGWSLRDIELTDATDLLEFMGRFAEVGNDDGPRKKKSYIDQVDL